MLFEEIVEGKKLSKNEIEKRQKGFYVFFDGGQKRIIYGSRENEDTVDFQELKGMVAFGGKAKGRVKIINNSCDICKMCDGDILVSICTSPTIILAMEKAAAFITDEGGITCHAAIVSRELKKPCIIGTKSATKVLRDGDLVEVDADKGVVRILERST